MRYFNNIFVGGVKETERTKNGLAVYENAELPMKVDGNVYLNNATAYSEEINNMVFKYNPEIEMIEKEDGIYLNMLIDKKIFNIKNQVVNTALLGNAVVPGLPFVNPDGSDITVDEDYFGRKRNLKNPAPGPFENPGKNLVSLKVWEK